MLTKLPNTEHILGGLGGPQCGSFYGSNRQFNLSLKGLHLAGGWPGGVLLLNTEAH